MKLPLGTTVYAKGGTVYRPGTEHPDRLFTDQQKDKIKKGEETERKILKRRNDKMKAIKSTAAETKKKAQDSVTQPEKTTDKK